MEAWTEVFTTASDFMWATNAEGRIELANPAMAQLLAEGTDVQDLGTLESCVSSESFSLVKGMLANAALTGQAQGELVLLTHSGEPLSVDVTTYRRGSADIPQGFVWIARKVGADGQTVPSVYRSKALLDTLLDHTPDCIYFKDIQSRFVRCSTAFQRVHKVPDMESVRGKTDFDLFAEQHAREAFEDEQQIMATGEPLVSKLEMETHPDGHVTWALTSKMPWRNSEGEILGTCGISKDVTALKDAEAHLETTHKSLLDASRTAGMAEVASDVLHNVGNVLNSVNVSCSVIHDHLKRSKLPNLSKLSDLITGNETRLAEYLTSDTQGKQVPEYLAGLAAHLGKERDLVMREIDQLNKHITHVKEIVSMQQNYAKMAGTIEEVSLPQLIDDALHINAAALVRHRVEVHRDFHEVPIVQTIKHKVLQILVNLIRNAKYAVDEAESANGWVRVTLATDGPEAVVVRITDNGVGIRPEHLHQIFRHGFTTRKDGHGFGLHSSATSARELAGSIEVASDGCGQGATFTLRIPVVFQPPRA